MEAGKKKKKKILTEETLFLFFFVLLKIINFWYFSIMINFCIIIIIIIVLLPLVPDSLFIINIVISIKSSLLTGVFFPIDSLAFCIILLLRIITSNGLFFSSFFSHPAVLLFSPLSFSFNTNRKNKMHFFFPFLKNLCISLSFLIV